MSLRKNPLLIWVAVILGSAILGGVGGRLVSLTVQNAQKETALSRRAEMQDEIIRDMGTLKIGSVLDNHDFDGLDHKPVFLREVVTSTTVLSVIDPDCGVCLDEIKSISEILPRDVFERRLLFISAGNPRYLVELKNAYDLPFRFLYDYNREWLTKYNITTFPFNIVVDSQLLIRDIIAAQLVPEDLKRIGLIP